MPRESGPTLHYTTILAAVFVLLQGIGFWWVGDQTTRLRLLELQVARSAEILVRLLEASKTQEAMTAQFHEQLLTVRREMLGLKADLEKRDYPLAQRQGR